jgi:hypothetical protein
MVLGKVRPLDFSKTIRTGDDSSSLYPVSLNLDTNLEEEEEEPLC